MHACFMNSTALCTACTVCNIGMYMQCLCIVIIPEKQDLKVGIMHACDHLFYACLNSRNCGYKTAAGS